MIIVELSGGIGNQMFQYALYLKLKKIGKDVSLDTSLLTGTGAFRYQELTDAFGICIDAVSSNFVNRIRGYAPNGDKVHNLLYRVMRNRKYHIYSDAIDFIQNNIFSEDNVILSGYWQSEKYFEDIKDVIMNEYVFANISDENIKLSMQMREEDSVSIHIRAKDYLNEANSKIYGGICTKLYYENAIKYVREHLAAPRFYLFTDDEQWVRTNFDIDKDVVIVDKNRGRQSYQDLYLISSCKNNIMANSSFSWWGAYLGNSEGIKICPTKWLNNHDIIENVACSNWLKM